MNKPVNSLRFAHSKGYKYCVALFNTGYIIEYTCEHKKGMHFNRNLEESIEQFENLLTMAKQIDNITYIED